MGLFFSIAVYAILLTGVFKLFQIATSLSEIKDLLEDVKRNTQEPSSPAFPSTQSPESLLRAVSAESYPEEADAKR